MHNYSNGRLCFEIVVWVDKVLHKQHFLSRIIGRIQSRIVQNQLGNNAVRINFVNYLQTTLFSKPLIPVPAFKKNASNLDISRSIHNTLMLLIQIRKIFTNVGISLLALYSRSF